VLGNTFVQVPHHVVAAQQQGGSGLVSLLPMLLIFGLIFYFFIIRPQRNRQRQMMELQRSLAPGQRVMTVAGLHATVSAIEDDVIVLEIAPGVECRYSKQAVTQVLDGTSSSDAEASSSSSSSSSSSASSSSSSDGESSA
jgi:preprotein translocase subunit YajC